MKRRNVLIDAICRVFLPRSRFADAIEASKMELAVQTKLPRKKNQDKDDPDSVEVLQALVTKTKVDHFKKNFAFSKLQDCTLFNFLDMCRDAHRCLSSSGHFTKYAKFGKDRILKAVSYGQPCDQDPLIILTKFSSKHFKKLSNYDLLKAYHDAKNTETATWYALLNKENWSVEEIINIADVMRLPFPIAAELLRRGLAAQALPYAFSSDDFRTAIQASSEMLKTQATTEANIVALVSAWRDKKPGVLNSPEALLKLATISNMKCVTSRGMNDIGDTIGPSLSALLGLLDSPLLTLASVSSLDTFHEMTGMVTSFGPSVTAFLKMYDPCESNVADADSLNQIIKHHQELRLRITKCHSGDAINVPFSAAGIAVEALEITHSAGEPSSNEENQDVRSGSPVELKNGATVGQVKAATVHVGRAKKGKTNKKKNKRNKKK